ncbi:CaiB/BaiF CoA-transferase family protein [Rhizorhabdus histidinilytica]|uniref:CaiB/BaiF CoA-transferase family protein n=1 Tax=Rhizorhabdus histidinilytica TaxID=439228 RepID=UPI00321F64DF
MTAAAIAGVRVIDASTGLAGSVAALMLAESGADVVKVEPPAGDPRRGTVAFAAWNRSKRSIAMDLAGADAMAFGELLNGADVLIHDGALPLPDLSTHPHLITCRISGVPDGFAGDLPADDFLVMAASGALAEQPALHRDGPAFVQLPLGSWCAAWLAAIGIGARLAQVARGGAPGPVDTSLLQGMLVPLMMLWRHAETPTPGFDGRIDKRVLPSIFECADGVWLHIMKNADDTPLMRQLLDEMGPDEVAKANAEWPPHFRYTNWGANVRAFRSRPSAEWLADLWAADIPVQPALPVGALYDDAQARANAYVVEVDDPDLGRVRQPGFPLRIDPPGGVKGPAPRADEHRAALLGEARPRKATPPPSTGRPLLDGIRVVDFGNYLAGPLSTMMLADLGADVIKVEPLAGDPMRANESAFLGCQRGKRSLALDLGHAGARAVIARLVAGADIVHHNLRLPAARRFGLDYPDLRAIRGDLIFGHVSAYGPAGERCYWPGYDQLFQASAGWELANAGEGNRPVWLRFGMMDHLCAMSLAYGMLLALIRRETSGEGSQVAASLLGASILTMADVAMRPDGTLIGRSDRLDRLQLGPSPGRRLASCADGWVAFAGPEDKAPDTEALAALPAREAVDRLRARGFAAVIVEEGGGPAFLFDEDHVRQGLVASYPHPVYGRLRHPGAFWSMPDAPLTIGRAPPVAGQHGRDILEGIGFSGDDIDALVRDRVVMLPET